jgi:hypothetical protein
MRPLVFTVLMLAGGAPPALHGQPAVPELDRKAWVLQQTLGPASMAGGVFSAGLTTWRARPVEYDTHWKGFGQRFGIRLSGVATQNAIEAGLGAIWREDPRYRRAASGSFRARFGSALKQTLLVQRADGSYQPAYARYAAIGGANFISNAWRPDSQATVSAALARTGIGFLGRLAGNTFAEFGGGFRSRLRGRKTSPPPPVVKKP